MDYEAIVTYILKNQGVSIVEIIRLLDGQGVPTDGDETLYFPYEPVVIWAGTTPEVQDVLQRLLDDDRIDFSVTHQMTYMVDGVALTIPLANTNSVLRRHPYKSERWWPIVFGSAES